MLLDTDSEHLRLLAAVERYHKLGLAAFEAAGQRPYSFVRHALMTAPLASRHNFRVDHSESIRVELIQLLYGSRWQEALEFCRKLRFFQQHAQSPLVDWAETIARRELPRLPSSTYGVSRKPDWEHPLEEELSKDAYNILAELHAILESDAMDDAARMITSIDPMTLSGVAPYGNDRQLLVSLAAASRLAVRDYPKLKALIDERFGPLAELRVRQAIAAGEVSAVRLAAVQFEATQAAAEAHVWLGDRALSSGWFARALADYERASKTAAASLRRSIADRMRLAGAMLGKEVGEPAEGVVVLGELKMPAEEFESLVAEMIARNVGSASSLVTFLDRAAAGKAVPAPTAFETHFRSKLDGLVGEQPTTEVVPHVRRYGVHWADRQIATMVERDLVYVSNRFQVAVYDLKDGQRKWQSARPTGTMRRAQEWALMPMRPLVTQERIVARLLYGTGPNLFCLDRDTGQIVWSTAFSAAESLISDPVLVQNQLVALTLLDTGQRESVLRLSAFSIQTGEILEQHELLRLRDSWAARRYCAVVPLDQSIVAALGGVVISVDLNGEVQWMRRQVVMPPQEEPQWVTQYFEPPLLDGGRLFVAQPGVRDIQCLDPDTGSRIWSVVIADIQRLVGIAENVVVVQTEQGFRGLDKANGKTLWTYDAENLLVAQLCSAKGGILFGQRQPVGGTTTLRPRLVWLDVKSGNATAYTELSGLDDVDPRLGPLVAHEDRLWTFFGRGHDDPNRDLVELVPAGEATQYSASAAIGSAWTGHVLQQLHEASAKVAPGWSLLNGAAGAQSGYVGEIAAESNILSVDSQANASVVFARRVEIPKDSEPKLRIRAGHPTAMNWIVRVQAGGDTLWDGALDAKFPDQLWRDLNVDLAQFRGQSVWLTVSGRGANPAAPVTTLWKTLEVAF